MIELCCFKAVDFYPSNLRGKTKGSGLLTIEDILPNIVTPENAIETGDCGERTLNYISALECYIYSKDAKNEEIIQYLKGEIDTLVL